MIYLHGNESPPDSDSGEGTRHLHQKKRRFGGGVMQRYVDWGYLVPMTFAAPPSFTLFLINQLKNENNNR
tara:strand:- start:1661 stop:1870 length:210 start_codon:yes stop_codon:yes gene_type:complete